ncbi:hypothetical protein GCM10027047_01450 [Rhodococcus aerolatus]
MSTDLDDPGDRLWDQLKDEAAERNWESYDWAWQVAGAPRLVEVYRCTDCGEPCDAVDYRDHDEGHSPQCPHDDPACELRVCEDHDGCETDTDRYTREQEARDEALRDEAADRLVAERREGVDR